MIRQFTLYSVIVLVAVGSGCNGGDGGPADMSTPIDLSHDAARDAGADANRDAGSNPGTCPVGRACDPAVGCNMLQQCQPERSIAQMVTDADGGTVTYSFTLYKGGYCTNARSDTTQALEGSPGACNPNRATGAPDPMQADGCPSCAKCISLGASSSVAGSPNIVQCAQRCTPNNTDNDVCRDGYQCDPSSGTCSFAECQSDFDCQAMVEDTNHDGTCSVATGDHQVVEPMNGAHCNTSTYRCERTGTPAAHAGDHCTADHECEANGRCLDECQFSAFTNGYCTKNFCNLPGNECAAGGTCLDAGNNFFLCAKTCSVGKEAAAAVLGDGGHGDTCDPNYACFPVTGVVAGAANNGGCLPGEYNAVAANNIGHACTMNSECYSPHGLGACIFGSPASACSLFDCAAFPDEDNVCGTGNTCFSFTLEQSACLHDCKTPADCAAAGAPADHGCVQITQTQKLCFPGCATNADCQATVPHCIGATQSLLGTCMP